MLFNFKFDLHFDDHKPLISVRTLLDFDGRKIIFWRGSIKDVTKIDFRDYQKRVTNELPKLPKKLVKIHLNNATIRANENWYIASELKRASLSERGPFINSNEDFVFEHSTEHFSDDDYQYLFCQCARYTFVV